MREEAQGAGLAREPGARVEGGTRAGEALGALEHVAVYGLEADDVGSAEAPAELVDEADELGVGRGLGVAHGESGADRPRVGEG
jgi:hypothetical protein